MSHNSTDPNRSIKVTGAGAQRHFVLSRDIRRGTPDTVAVHHTYRDQGEQMSVHVGDVDYAILDTALGLAQSGIQPFWSQNLGVFTKNGEAVGYALLTYDMPYATDSTMQLVLRLIVDENEENDHARVIIRSPASIALALR